VLSAVLPKLPRNSQPDFAQYTNERPELTAHGEKSTKAKTTKGVYEKPKLCTQEIQSGAHRSGIKDHHTGTNFRAKFFFK
jgi:hypothetical protein